MRCRNCHYSLKGLTKSRCPECGRGFDPNDPNTFEYSGTIRFSWTLLRDLALVWGVVCVLILAFGAMSQFPFVLLDSVVLGLMVSSVAITFLLFPVVLLVTEARVQRSRKKLDEEERQ